jgi:hypothetical protein
MHRDGHSDLSARVHLQLAQKLRHVRFHGRFPDSEDVGDLLVAQALSDERQHATLLRRQALQSFSEQPPSLVRTLHSEMRYEWGCNPGSLARDCLDGPNERLLACRFRDKSGRSVAQSLLEWTRQPDRRNRRPGLPKRRAAQHDDPVVACRLTLIGTQKKECARAARSELQAGVFQTFHLVDYGVRKVKLHDLCKCISNYDAIVDDQDQHKPLTPKPSRRGILARGPRSAHFGATCGRQRGEVESVARTLPGPLKGLEVPRVPEPEA